MENGFETIAASKTNEGVLEAAHRIGKVFKPDSMPLIQTLTPRTQQDAPLSTYSGNFGVGRFPFHTDMAHWHRPPRYILLFCEVPDVRVSTEILHWRNVYPHINKWMHSARFMPRRRLNNQMFRLRIHDGEINRWDPIFIAPQNNSAVALCSFMNENDWGAGCNRVSMSKPGEMLIIDNWKALHSRTSVPADSHRVLRRIYLSELN